MKGVWREYNIDYDNYGAISLFIDNVFSEELHLIPRMTEQEIYTVDYLNTLIVEGWRRHGPIKYSRRARSDSGDECQESSNAETLQE